MAPLPPIDSFPFLGWELPPVIHPLTFTDLVRYAGVSGDFFPLHHDDAFAVKAGMGGVFAHGMLSAGLLGSAVTDYFGIESLRRFTVRFTEPARPGEILVSTARIRSLDRSGSSSISVLDCLLANELGRTKVRGQATFEVRR